MMDRQCWIHGCTNPTVDGALCESHHAMAYPQDPQHVAWLREYQAAKQARYEEKKAERAELDPRQVATMLKNNHSPPPEEEMTVDPDTQRGLYGKYRVMKIKRETDQRGEEIEVLVEPSGPVFVLAYTSDPHARVALAAYADSCAAEFPQLAEDLRRALSV